jgi:hypothetical protein
MPKSMGTRPKGSFFPMIRRTDDSPLPAALIIGPARGDDVLPAFSAIPK